METIHSTDRLFDEIADLFASSPSPETILAFHPSPAVQERARHLLNRSRDGQLSDEERRELDQFEQVEILMRLVKARIHAHAHP